MNEDHQDQVQFPPLSTISYNHTSALSCPNLQNSQQDQGAILREQQLSQQQDQSNEHLSMEGSSVQLFFNTELAVDHTREEQTDALPVKWMSSKMRLMRKMMGEDRIVVGKQGGQGLRGQAQSNPECSSSSSSNGTNNSPTGIIRVCSNCNTTKTPLWRSGPQGPKSLCNACGIRQMKARRALRAAAAAATAASNGGVLVPATAPKIKAAKDHERSEVDRTVPFKKRFKMATASSAQKKLRFDDITVGLTKKLAFHQTSAFPQEEKDAAILLMALSCGLIHG
ncbi:putative GATA transcription factor 22 isoform X1 [Iris pallida]|uniref:GATA transcription factor 22 isoform X1 n=1 Tax=Iris pallida TaxID=29817 RepID=A0AAX6EDA5_IRIPA|nr:putative GATA transcription factor 22 isoform X1 [Iris pallida]